MSVEEHDARVRAWAALGLGVGRDHHSTIRTATRRRQSEGETSAMSKASRVGMTAATPFASHAILGRVTDPLATDETRIDRWLCAVRLVKTRPLATRLCDGGHVLVNGSPAKPSTKVRAGDRVEALIADRERIVEVMRPIESRVGAAVAATCYVDHSPPVVRGGRARDHARPRGGPAEQAPAARAGAPAPGCRRLSARRLDGGGTPKGTDRGIHLFRRAVDCR